jgi:uncharacterized protein (DUF1684 family)
MKKIYNVVVLLCVGLVGMAQTGTAYVNNIKAYQKNYVTTHEVVKGKDRNFFRFYGADEKYKINCRFERSSDTTIIPMKTSGTKIPQKDFVRYGKLLFTIHDTTLQLTVFQSKSLPQTDEYKNLLFIPFADATSGDETYGTGRYIDISINDIINNTVIIDFNKAYNPYCAYSTGYNCPIPPAENYLAVAVKAGERSFAKPTGH